MMVLIGNLVTLRASWWLYKQCPTQWLYDENEDGVRRAVSFLETTYQSNYCVQKFD